MYFAIHGRADNYVTINRQKEMSLLGFGYGIKERLITVIGDGRIFNGSVLCEFTPLGFVFNLFVHIVCPQDFVIITIRCFTMFECTYNRILYCCGRFVKFQMK